MSTSREIAAQIKSFAKTTRDVPVSEIASSKKQRLTQTNIPAETKTQRMPEVKSNANIFTLSSKNPDHINQLFIKFFQNVFLSPFHQPSNMLDLDFMLCFMGAQINLSTGSEAPNNYQIKINDLIKKLKLSLLWEPIDTVNEYWSSYDLLQEDIEDALLKSTLIRIEDYLEYFIELLKAGDTHSAEKLWNNQPYFYLYRHLILLPISDQMDLLDHVCNAKNVTASFMEEYVKTFHPIALCQASKMSYSHPDAKYIINKAIESIQSDDIDASINIDPSSTSVLASSYLEEGVTHLYLKIATMLFKNVLKTKNQFQIDFFLSQDIELSNYFSGLRITIENRPYQMEQKYLISWFEVALNSQNESLCRAILNHNNINLPLEIKSLQRISQIDILNRICANTITDATDISTAFVADYIKCVYGQEIEKVQNNILVDYLTSLPERQLPCENKIIVILNQLLGIPLQQNTIDENNVPDISVLIFQQQHQQQMAILLDDQEQKIAILLDDQEQKMAALHFKQQQEITNLQYQLPNQQMSNQLHQQTASLQDQQWQAIASLHHQQWQEMANLHDQELQAIADIHVQELQAMANPYFPQQQQSEEQNTASMLMQLKNSNQSLPPGTPYPISSDTGMGLQRFCLLASSVIPNSLISGEENNRTHSSLPSNQSYS